MMESGVSGAPEDLLDLLSSARCVLWQAHLHRQGEQLAWDMAVRNEEAAAAVFPLRLQENQSYSSAWLSSLTLDDRRKRDEAILAAMGSASPFSRHAYRITHENREPQWVLEDVALERQGADLYRAVGVCMEMTTSMIDEMALQQNETRLYPVLDEMQRTRQQAAEARLRADHQRSRSIAHHLNNALLPILSLSDFMIEQPETLRDEERVLHYLRLIQTATQDAAGIVRRLADWNHPETDEASPLSSPTAKDSTLNAVKNEPPLLNILLVDDDEMVREMMQEFLTAEGHRVQCAKDGREALGLFVDEEFDLILTDRAMPGMSGDHLAASIKELDPEQPIVMITGYGEEDLEMPESPQAADYLLQKPVQLKELKRVIARAVSGVPDR